MLLPSSISTRLQYQHKSLIDIIDGLSDEQIRRPVFAGKWSIFENIVHLETYQLVFIQRIRKILETDNPQFESYSADMDPLFHDHLSRQSHEVIHDLLSLRKSMAAEISNFQEFDIVRKGVHPVFGELSLTGWLNFFLLHEAHHLFTMFKLAAALKKIGA